MHERSRLATVASALAAAIGAGTLLVLTAAYRLYKTSAHEPGKAGRRPPRPARIPSRVAAPPAHPRARRTVSAHRDRDLAAAPLPIDDFAV